MAKMTRGKFRMTKTHGIELEGQLSPWLRFCVGAAVLLMAGSFFLAAGVAAMRLFGS